MLLFSLTIWILDDEWFPGTITAAIPNEGTFDIRYDDGDVGESQHSGCFQRLKTEWELGQKKPSLSSQD